MEKEKIKTQIFVKEHAVNIMKINGEEYISLTDLAKSQNNDAPADVIKNWMRSRESISFLGLWEELNNSNFKLVEFDQFKNEAGSHTFTLSPHLKNGLGKQMSWYYFKIRKIRWWYICNK